MADQKSAGEWGNRHKTNKKTTLQQGANVWKSSSPSYLEKQMLSREILVNMASAVCTVYTLMSLLYAAAYCTGGQTQHFPIHLFFFPLTVISYLIG